MLLVVFSTIPMGCSGKPAANDPPEVIAEPDAFVPEGPPRVSVRELCMAYDKNETAANDAYLEKRIELSGRVLDRGTDLKIHYLYVGADTSRYHDEPEIKCSIRCEFPQSEYNNLVTLWHDKSVYVIGRVVGKVGPNITMRDCRID